jgi:hypothetical protein
MATAQKLTEELELQERNYQALMRDRDSYRDAWKYEQQLRVQTRAQINRAAALHAQRCKSKPCDLCLALILPDPFPTPEETR